VIPAGPPPGLLEEIRRGYRLEWEGLHGRAHWERVRENGLFLAANGGARADVVELFAWVHDARRHDEGSDPGHGPRAARFARDLHARGLLPIDAPGLELLVEACAGHTRGTTTTEATIGACWDSDRLDLGRVGKRPRPELLSTEAARAQKVIARAYARSLGRTDP